MKKICFIGDSHTEYVIKNAINNNIPGDAQTDTFSLGYTEIIEDVKRMITNKDNKIMEFSDHFFTYKDNDREIGIVSLSGRSAWGYDYEKYEFFKNINENEFEIFLWLGYKDINYNIHKNRNVDDVINKYVNNATNFFKKTNKITFISPIPPFRILDHPATFEERHKYYKEFIKNLEKKCHEENKINKKVNFINLQSIYANIDIENFLQCDADHWEIKNYRKITDYFLEAIGGIKR